MKPLVTGPPHVEAGSVARLLAGIRPDGMPVSLADHLRRYGPPTLEAGSSQRASDAIAQMVEASGLTGRGGAGFPTGRKLRAVAPSRRALVVANGVEGEPCSAKDKALLRLVPHLVLDGSALAAAAVGADDAVVAVGRHAHHEHRVLIEALAERRRRRLDAVRLEVSRVPDRFVSGQETALVRALSGGPARPTLAPPRPSERGVRGIPTLVLNVETLAHVALIARFGAGWFRRLGTPAEPGSALVTLSGAISAPGVYEIELGTPLGELLTTAGGATADLSAFLIGGFFGSSAGRTNRCRREAPQR